MMSEEKEMKDLAKVLIPMIRRTLPGLVAQSITGVQPMSTSSMIPFDQGTVLNSDQTIKWYWVRLPYEYDPGKIFKYNNTTVHAETNTVDEKEVWLKEMFGEPSVDRWIVHDKEYHFRYQEDLAVFLLRWRGA